MKTWVVQVPILRWAFFMTVSYITRVLISDVFVVLFGVLPLTGFTSRYSLINSYIVDVMFCDNLDNFSCPN